MEKYKQIIILSNKYQTNEENILVISTPVILEDDAHLINNGDTYTFEYLIFTDPFQISNFLKTSILQENDLPITNCLYQTNIENIYYPKDEKIDEALQNIFENN